MKHSVSEAEIIRATEILQLCTSIREPSDALGSLFRSAKNFIVQQTR